VEALPSRPAAFSRGASVKPMEEAVSFLSPMPHSSSSAAMPTEGEPEIFSRPIFTRRGFRP
jgi:hypothetical protein